MFKVRCRPRVCVNKSVTCADERSCRSGTASRAIVLSVCVKERKRLLPGCCVCVARPFLLHWARTLHSPQRQLQPRYATWPHLYPTHENTHTHKNGLPIHGIFFIVFPHKVFCNVFSNPPVASPLLLFVVVSLDGNSSSPVNVVFRVEDSSCAVSVFFTF